MGERGSVAPARVRVEVAPAADGRRRVNVCAGTACVFAGSLKVFDAFRSELAAAGLQDEVELSIIGCHGLCSQGPLAVVGRRRDVLPAAQAEGCDARGQRAPCGWHGGRRPAVRRTPPAAIACAAGTTSPSTSSRRGSRSGTWAPSTRSGIEEYLARGGYDAARTVLTEKTPEWVIEEVLGQRAARPRWRRLSHRHEVEVRRRLARPGQVPHLQR